jgi:ferredoxin-NADP reductase
MFHEYIVGKIVHESNTIKSFYFKSKKSEPLPDFLPGQFVNIKIKLPHSDKELTRSYTLSDSPKGAFLRLTVKKEPRGKVSSYLHDVLKPGDTILLSKPAGNFHLANQNNNPVVLISGGVGITPMISIAEYINRYQPTRQIYFIHSSIDKNVQPMMQRLLQMKTTNINFELSIFHSYPLENEVINIDYDYRGLISRNHIPTVSNADYYVCGPVGFMETMHNYLNELEVHENKVYFEFFGVKKKFGAKQVFADSKTTSFDIKLIKSNKLISWKAGMGSLLELIESVGLTPDNSCRMGTCSTCESKLIKGTFGYDPEPFMEVAEGKILICCAKPTSDMEIEL